MSSTSSCSVRVKLRNAGTRKRRCAAKESLVEGEMCRECGTIWRTQEGARRERIRGMSMVLKAWMRVSAVWRWGVCREEVVEEADIVVLEDI